MKSGRLTGVVSCTAHRLEALHQCTQCVCGSAFACTCVCMCVDICVLGAGEGHYKKDLKHLGFIREQVLTGSFVLLSKSKV